MAAAQVEPRTVNPPYTYRANIISVHDGDTLHLDVDLGFHLTVDLPVRLHGINTRELKDPGGKEARAHLLELVTIGSEVLFRSLGPDKYGGRWLGVLTLPDGRDVATQMIRDRYAAPWDGKGAKPVPAWPLPA
jgi:endonuclease YncB( thermonuclease family)